MEMLLINSDYLVTAKATYGFFDGAPRVETIDYELEGGRRGRLTILPPSWRPWPSTATGVLTWVCNRGSASHDWLLVDDPLEWEKVLKWFFKIRGHREVEICGKSFAEATPPKPEEDPN